MRGDFLLPQAERAVATALQKDRASLYRVSLRLHSKIKTMQRSQLALLFINRFITSRSSPLDWRPTAPRKAG